MLRLATLALLLGGCVGTVMEDELDPASGDQDEDTDDGAPPDEEPAPVETPEPEPSELPDMIDGVPVFQLPFPCAQVWAGQTRTNHSPAPSVDFNRADDLGDDVVAAASGVVARVENLGATSYGRWIEINHGNGYRTRYAHLATQTVSVGQSVKRGAKIGTLGNTGGSTGPHLHYEQRKDGVPQRVTFNLMGGLYYGTKNYTSQNGCAGIVGRVNTGGDTLTIRADASTTSAAVGSVANAAQVTITCQKNGESVTGTYGTSTLWNKIGVGYVPDVFVLTGSDGQIAPTCP